MGLLRAWNRINLFTRIMIGFAVGVAVGVIFGPQASVLEFLGTILIRLLSMVVAPLVLCMLICAAADVGDVKTLGRMGITTTLFYTLTTVVAISVGLFFAYVMNVGTGVDLNLEGQAGSAVNVPSMITTLVNIIPSNPFAALNTANLLQIMFFAMIFGFALTKLKGEGSKITIEFFRTCANVMKEIVNIVLAFTPIGVMGTMANVVGKHGLAIMLPFGKIILATYIACALYFVLFQSVLLAGVLGRTNPLTFIKKMREPALFAFATCSSVATMPLTLKSTKELGASEKVANFVIPYGTVINLDGSAIYQAIAVVFTAQIYGVDLTITQLALVVLSATLASIGTAGVPGSALIMLTVVLGAVNLPIEAVALLAGIDRILNMARVVPNVIGDAAVAMIIERQDRKYAQQEAKVTA